ncbi:M15 family metallopeptidase [Clostridioides difficile]
MKQRIDKKIKITVVLIFLCSVVYLVMHKNNIEKNNGEINKNEINLASANNKDLENNATKNNYNEIENLEKILNNEFFILVNKDNKLSEDYVPNNLKLSEIKFLDYIETRDLESTTADALKEMFDAALEDGVTLLGASGYRSYNIQKNLYDSRVASMGEERTSLYTAQPGASEHQTGLAIDILSSDYQNLDDGFENSKGFEWLINNCYKYGFILRYLEGKEDITGYNYEPWHFRYIGNVEIAKDIMERGIVFEEYINELNNKIEDLKSNN